MVQQRQAAATEPESTAATFITSARRRIRKGEDQSRVRHRDCPHTFDQHDCPRPPPAGPLTTPQPLLLARQATLQELSLPCCAEDVGTAPPSAASQAGGRSQGLQPAAKRARKGSPPRSVPHEASAKVRHHCYWGARHLPWHRACTLHPLPVWSMQLLLYPGALPDCSKDGLTSDRGVRAQEGPALQPEQEPAPVSRTTPEDHTSSPASSSDSRDNAENAQPPAPPVALQVCGSPGAHIPECKPYVACSIDHELALLPGKAA